MIETRRLKNVVIFMQTILCFVLSRKIMSKVLINHILPDTLFKPKCKNKWNSLHSIKIIIQSNPLYYLFLCLCARNFSRFVELFPRRAKFM